jgi:hypothetical protein
MAFHLMHGASKCNSCWCLQSTLFNALSDSAKAQAANFPFCTIEPNTSLVAVPDDRLNVRTTPAPAHAY